MACSWLRLEPAAIVVVRRPGPGQPTPKPLLCNGELGESLEIFIPGRGSGAPDMSSERIDDAQLDCPPRTRRRCKIDAFSFFPGASFLDR
jgi:hypothetical protein